MKLVILESPFAGDVERNIKYARAAVRDSLLRGEAPIASHLLYTQDGVLNDDIPEERQHGIDAGLAWREVSHGTVVYTDFGFSRGMEYGMARARESGKTVELRTLPPEVLAELFPEVMANLARISLERKAQPLFPSSQELSNDPSS
ncbi:hypothetical protein [Paraburkholderia sp. UCT31]|uniref:DUF7768 domain-containing protein n=1 Tax=Paraburkholderia sp. UCT31 TaxID=2615209 RepID=UPI001CA3999D|nr:hypothetical protein [Paraburkholderia sp. UCT31]